MLTVTIKSVLLIVILLTVIYTVSLKLSVPIKLVLLSVWCRLAFMLSVTITEIMLCVIKLSGVQGFVMYAVCSKLVFLFKLVFVTDKRKDSNLPWNLSIFCKLQILNAL